MRVPAVAAELRERPLDQVAFGGASATCGVGDDQEATWIASRLPASTIRRRELGAFVGRSS